MNTISLSPASSHTSRKVDITGKGFEPNSPLTIQGSLICLEEGHDFQSYAHIHTDDAGGFDMATTESRNGTYTGVDKIGLFWSMKRQRNSFHRACLQNGMQQLEYTFNAYQGHVDTFEEPVLCANGFSLKVSV